MNEIEYLQQRIEEIEKRNQKVEIDKTWETSWTRRILLIGFTYVSIGLYMWVIDVSRPWLNAIIPSLGFLLSTLTLPFFKERWVKDSSRKIR
jgi:hypothetical protein